jgi:beta-aspartyl-dipeptidase (metallo-type)
MDSLLQSLQQAVLQHGLSLENALPAFTASPAAIWGLPRKGVIAPGADADLLLLDPQTLAIEATVAGGQLHLF